MSKMEGPSNPLARFVARLFDTPGLRPLSALQKEEQALHFLRENGPRLSGVFASLGLPTGEGWREAAAAVAGAIRTESDRLLSEELTDVVSSHLSFSFFPVLYANRQLPPQARTELIAFLGRTAKGPVSRSALSGSLTAVRAGLTEKYIPLAWGRKKYFYVEVTRVQRLTLGPSELSDLVQFALVLRPGAYLHVTPGGTTPDKDAGFAPLQERSLEKLLPASSSALPSFPPPLLRMALRSALAFPATSSLEAVARAAGILAQRGRTLTPGMVVDRGADTPDKSWFNVTRKNARWHGLDPALLDECYTIAAENGW
jgi:hypothetical protein